jgi:hypothetical protein
MARESSYALIQVGETSEADLEDVANGSATYDGGSLSTRVGTTKYAKLLALVVLLVGAVGIYSIANSPPDTVRAQPNDKGYDEASNNRFYEVAEDTDTTASPDLGTVVGQLLMQVSKPDEFANDAAALQAVKETIAEIAGVPVSAVRDVKMVPVSGGNGEVRADFTVDVSADQANQVSDRISNSTPEADSAILSNRIKAAGLSATYPETKVVEVTASVATTTQTPVNPCVTTVNPCVTTLAPTTAPVNPCATTLAPANPCATTQASTVFGKLSKLFR